MGGLLPRGDDDRGTLYRGRAGLSSGFVRRTILHTPHGRRRREAWAKRAVGVAALPHGTHSPRADSLFSAAVLRIIPPSVTWADEATRIL